MTSNRARQLPLFNETRGVRGPEPPGPPTPSRAEVPPVKARCAACRAKEARYGFREADLIERSSTLCFECFRLELDRRAHEAAAAERRASRTRDVDTDLFDELTRRRRRAQIAARKALGLE
jgi:hypothetical protein